MNVPLTSDQRMMKLLQATPQQIEAVDRVLNGDPPPKSRVLDGPALLGSSAAAKLLGVTRGTLWRMIHAGTIHKVQLYRGSYRVLRVELEDLIAKGFSE